MTNKNVKLKGSEVTSETEQHYRHLKRVCVRAMCMNVCVSGLSTDRPCARSVKVDCPCPMAQIAARGSVVWALSEQRVLFYREGLSSYCAEGEQWKYDKVRYPHPSPDLHRNYFVLKC